MMTLKSLLPGSVALLLTTLFFPRLSSASPDIEACWEPHTSDAPVGTLCWYDDSASGLGWQAGVTSSLSIDDQPPVITCSQKQKISVSIPPQASRFFWLKARSVQQIKKLSFFETINFFISKVPYCSGTQLPGKDKFPVIPVQYQMSSPYDDRICRILKGNKFIVGLSANLGDCEDLFGIIYDDYSKTGFKTMPQQQWKPAAQVKPNWVERPFAAWAYYYATKSDGSEVQVYDKIRCGDHCKATAKQKAQERHHKYMTYDGKYYHTGTDINTVDRDHGENRVFENLNEK